MNKLIGLLLFTSLIGLSNAVSQAQSPTGAPMATADRVQGSGWWPTKGTAAREDYVGPDACAQCHRAKVNGARKTPMAHASMPVADSEALRSHNRLETQIGPFHYQIVSTAQGVEYSVTDGTKSASVPLT